MLDYLEKYHQWLSDKTVDINTKNELLSIENNPDEIKESFYKDLEFGTGGLRGIIGAGTNRMNIYTVRRATQGLARYICDHGKSAMERGVVIAYDSRLYSDLFALEAARVLATNKIKVFLFDELKPTPELSFAIRYLGCISGIIITASHNPAKYNGYKAYWDDGAQLSPDSADKVFKYINETNIFEDIEIISKVEAVSQGLIEMIGAKVDEAYLSNVFSQSIDANAAQRVGDKLKIVYTPFHGAGNKPVRKILSMTGISNVYVVREQEDPDPAFPTVKSPNPEDAEGFLYAIELAKKTDSPLIIGTDPDSDRLGLMVRNKEGNYITLSGNQVGVLLINFILSRRKALNILPKDPVIVKTIVTTELAKVVAESYGAKVYDVLTGFKFIGEVIKQLEETGEENRFTFGYEESYGYLAGTYARDKDAVVASMLVAQMAACYLERDMTLYDALQEIFEKYGYYFEDQTSIVMEGISGQEQIQKLIDDLRSNTPKEVGGIRVTALRDYKLQVRTDFTTGEKTKLTLPVSNVLYFELENGTHFVARPSGTEPKIKFYCFANDKMQEKAYKKLASLKESVLSMVK